MSDFYTEKLNEIKELIKTDKSKAMNLLQEELAMPYIPEKYEKEFHELAKSLIVEQMKEVNEKTLSTKEVIEFLWSKDEVKEAAAIDSLGTQNLRAIKDELKKWVESENNAIGKAFIYESLVSQDVDIELNISGKTLNPAVDKSILENKEVLSSFMFVRAAAVESPQLQDAVEDQLRLYILLTFPITPLDGKLLATQIFNVVKKMMGEEIELSEQEKKTFEILKG